MTNEQTVLSRLAALFPQAKKTTLRAMVEQKRVRLNGAVVKSLKEAVGEKDKFEVTDLSEAPSKAVALAEGLKVVYVDSQIAIVDKPSGLLTATGPTEERPTVLKILGAYLRKQNSKNQVHLVHRLDKDASGLLVFARTTEALRQLKHQFMEHTITRRYDALVHGIPKKAGRLEDFLIEDERTGRVSVTQDEKKGQLAILDYVVIQSDAKKKLAHLQCTLYTGRKHQIRVQLASRGHAVLADPIYGKFARPPARPFSERDRRPVERVEAAPAEAPGRLALHASHLTLKHPGSGREMSFDSGMPGGFAGLFRP